MKLSVVIPSYNHAKFIGATLESVLTQGYQNLEVLVYDGGSTDETLSILQSYEDKIEFVSERDGGQADAINQGLQRATGDILTFLNSDDIYCPHALEQVVNYFSANRDCLALYGDAYHLHENGSVMEPYYTEPWSYPRLLEVCYLCQPAVFWRREVIERFGILDDTLHYALDYDYWLRVGRETDFSYLEGAYLAGSRLHQDTKTLKQRVSMHHEILEVAMRHSPAPPYRWLMNLAHAIVDAEQQRIGAQMDERTRRGLLVKAVLENADLRDIPLSGEVLAKLEEWLTVS